MNRSDRPVIRRRFQLFRGNGEAERLDRFLAAADPLAVAAPRPEARKARSDRWIWGLVLVLAAAFLLPVLRRSWPAEPLLYQKQIDLLVDRGKDLASEDHKDEALDVLGLTVALAPDDAEAWAALADCQSANDQSMQAQRSYQRALSLKPENAVALSGLGNLYLQLGDERRAEQAWQRIGLDRQLARLYLLEGKFSQAETHLARLLNAGADDDLVSRMARAARARRLDPKLRSFLAPEPAGLSAWAESGWRLYHQKRYDEAADSFRRALARAPHDVNALSGMGSVLLELGRPATARPYFEHALSLRGDHLRSLNGRASCLRSEGKTREAIAVWQKVVEIYPGVSEASRGLAFTYLKLQDYHQAALYLVPLAKRYPHNPQVLQALDVARKMGS